MSESAQLVVRELQSKDVSHLLDYWYLASAEQINKMGADKNKLPPRQIFEKKLLHQITEAYENKASYVMIWSANHKAIGHCNINQITFGSDAYMHLHSWYPENRKKGMGTAFVKLCIPYFFKNYHLEKLYCQPYALNPAPNKTMEHLGFNFVKKHSCIPGSINFEQEVKLWELTKSNFNKWS